MKFEIASYSDIPELCTLLDSLFEQEVEFRPNREAQIQGLELVIKNSNLGTILIARDNDEVIGMVNLLYTVSTALGARVGILEDMVIDNSTRGSGIGSKLIQFALGFAQEHGCKRVTLLTDNDNVGAHKFYQKHGFKRSPMVVYRKLIHD